MQELSISRIVSDDLRFTDSLTDSNFGDIRCVIVAVCRHFSMEECFQRCLGPRRARVLVAVLLSVRPIGRVFREVRLKEITGFDERNCGVISAIVLAFVLRMGPFTEGLET